MADLLLCDGSAASVPYYVEGMSVNIYSLEELCYYMAQCTQLLEKNFMNAELVGWIGRDLHQKDLASRLDAILDGGGRLSEFVMTILKASDYCTAEEKQRVFRELTEMEEKSPFERSKLFADHLMESGRVISAVYEYKNLLEEEDHTQVSDLLLGDVWHNLGTAYARLFLFDEAAACYRSAYAKNERLESLKSFLYVLLAKGDDMALHNEAEEYHIDDVTLTSWENEFALRSAGNGKSVFEKELSALNGYARAGKSAAYKEKTQDILSEWKKQYRRMCGA